jgi:type II secretory pathway pseudopilin PulG
MTTLSPKPSRATEQGFMLLGLIVAIFLILLVLGVAAPRVARSLRREREVEAVHRGQQYVRAIRQYYLKTGHYPGSIEQLEKTNNVRFLRQRYVDPMTGKSDWRLIHVGEAKTTVKGFFGKPLSGLPGANAGLGSAAGMASSGQAGAGAAGTASGSSSTFGSSSFGSSSSGSSFGSSTAGSSASASGTVTDSQSGSQTGSSFGSVAGSTGSSSSGSTSGSSSSSGISSQSATSFTGTGAPIMGVGSSAPGDSIVVLNEQTTYPTWEFIYDPRIEQLKAKAAMLGGPASSSGSGTSSFGTGTSSFGTGTNGTGTNSTGTNGTAAPGTTTTPAPTTTGIPVQP